MRTSVMDRAALSLAVVAVLAGSLSRAASGGTFHLRLTKSEPAMNDTIPAPAVLKFWFSEEPELAITRVTLVGERADTVALAAPSHAKGIVNPVMAGIKGRLVPGRYAVWWRAASADGHAQSGTFAFVVRAARTDRQAR